MSEIHTWFDFKTTAMTQMDNPVMLAGLSDFLDKTTQSKQYKYLLAHATDGVIWGHCVEGRWLLSSGRVPNSPELKEETLLNLRLFGDKAEQFVWRTAVGFHGREISEVAPTDDAVAYDYYDEPQNLWGTYAHPLEDGFLYLEHGRDGFVQAVPIPMPSQPLDARPIKLTVRHYLLSDPHTGIARVKMSRLQALGE